MLRPIWGEDRREDAPSAGDVDALPTAFPIFPLPRALLLPEGRIPLNIFEPRYLNLVESALARGRMFGMILPRSRVEAAASGGRADAPPIANLQRVGCLGRISSFAETDDGCFIITLTGLARFDVRAERPLERGFRSVEASFERFAADLLPAPEITLNRARLVGQLRRYFAARGLDANWGAIDEMPDVMLINTLCMVCPFSDGEKQALLEAPDVAARARDLQALLAFAEHEGDGGDRPRNVS